ncbi:fimbrial protein [Proteus terrae]|uniref:fimbrial protein n=1 Tax=Proteus terrae TaxID=1574161 RepID=UPI00301D8685
MTILIRFFILITSVIISFPLLAGNTVTVNFSGNIRAATCNISGGSNINIDLKEMPANLFKTTNSSSVWNNFTIKLIDCSPTINQVKLRKVRTSS